MIKNIFFNTTKKFNISGKISITIFLFISAWLPCSAHAKTLAVFPFAVYSDKPSDFIRHGVNSMLTSRLSGGDIEIIRYKDFESLLIGDEKNGIIKEKRAEELSRKLNLDFSIFGSITTLAKSYSLDLSVFTLKPKGASLKKISHVLKEDQFIPKLSDIAYQIRAVIEGKEIAIPKTAAPSPIIDDSKTSPMGIFSEIGKEKKGSADIEKGLFFQETREAKGFKPTGKISVDFSIMAFAVGNLDGKDGAELIMLGRKKLFIYTKKGDAFVNVDILKAGIGEDFIKVSVGDADKNGLTEIYLISRYGIRARTTVLKWSGSFKKLNRLTGHLQAIKDPSKNKTVLLFQASKADEFFQGPLFFMDYDQQGKLVQSDKAPKLKGAQFYTVALFDLDKDGNNEWIGLGEDSRLQVWNNQGNVIWKGTKQLGGTNNAIRIGNAAPGELSPRVSFNSRPLITDIDHDGKEEILVVKNIPLVKHMADFKVYDKSSLIGYRIEGTDLSPAWETRDTDFCLVGMEGYGRTLYLAAQKAKIINIKKGSGLVMWFD
ncbi:MAG: hypothetical protein U9R17_05460 [Thermodesulfobacteriota bacterium]|nr:hypothetical protein [Thermodesulfobacteriota bacterium]